MAKRVVNEYDPDFVTSPGEMLKEALEEHGMSQGELAERMGSTSDMADEIITGAAPITGEVALQLEQALGIPARFWNNREHIYREHLGA